MLDCIFDGLIDTLKLLPYLLVTFLILEFIENKMSSRNAKMLSTNKKFGPVVGGLLGALPQCGFSSMSASLFSARVISMGTLIAVFLSTSDEMLPIMISEQVDTLMLLKIIGFKVLVGVIIGFIVDIIFKKNLKGEIHDLCERDHCDCEEHGIFISSLLHTLKIGLFILIANLAINLIIFYIGEDSLSNLLLNRNVFTYFVSSLIGLIPNCSGSVIITELYLSNLITVGTMLAGLLTGSGLGILLLFRNNKNLKDNLTVLFVIYFTGVIIGILFDVFI